MRLLVAVLAGLCWVVQAQSPKEQKILEINARISSLERELESLKALRSSIEAGHIPESALGFINTGPQPAVASLPVPTVVSGAPQNQKPEGTTNMPEAAKTPSPSNAASATAKPTTTETPTGLKSSTGADIYQGPRGGQYHYSASGKKVYEKKK